jgi:hypothetical protein
MAVAGKDRVEAAGIFLVLGYSGFKSIKLCELTFHVNAVQDTSYHYRRTDKFF